MDKVNIKVNITENPDGSCDHEYLDGDTSEPIALLTKLQDYGGDRPWRLKEKRLRRQWDPVQKRFSQTTKTYWNTTSYNRYGTQAMYENLGAALSRHITKGRNLNA